MNIEPTDLPGVLIITPRVFKDARGFFFESYNADKFKAHGIDTVFVQDNHSQSTRGTLRGLHFQLPPMAQDKLVRCVRGVDLGRGGGHPRRLAHLRPLGRRRAERR